MTFIEEKKPASYDKAGALLVKLRDLADYQSHVADFNTRVTDLQELSDIPFERVRRLHFGK